MIGSLQWSLRRRPRCRERGRVRHEPAGRRRTAWQVAAMTGRSQKSPAIVKPYPKRVVVWFNGENLVGGVATGFGGTAPCEQGKKPEAEA